MPEIKQIQCPSCGSGDTIKLSYRDYQCTYCKSNFIIEENVVNSNQSNSHTVNTVNTITNVGTSKIIKLGVIGALATIVGFISVTFFLRSSFLRSSAIGVDYFKTNESLIDYKVFATPKGAFIWLIKSNYSDTAKYPQLLIINPITGKYTSKKVPNDFFGFSGYNSQILNNNFYVFGKNSIKVYDVATGTTIYNNDSLISKNEELKPGILSIQFSSGTKTISVTTVLGDEYSLSLDNLKIDNHKNTANRSNTINTELHLTDGLKPLLAIVKYKDGTNAWPVVTDNTMCGRISNSYFKNDSVYDYMYFENKISIQKTSNKVYYNAMVLCKTTNEIIIAYTETLSENTNQLFMIDCVNKTGKTKWRLKNKLFTGDILKDNTFCSNRLIKAVASNSLFAITMKNNSKEGKLYIPSITKGYSIETGQLLWENNAINYLNK